MSKPVRLIKKYPNRRLYDTETSSYITLSEVKQLVLDHRDFQVVDAKSNQDLTRNILMQIILEEEAGVDPLFTSDMLSQMIRSYGNAMQGFMGNYLEKGIQSFVDIQKKLQEQSAAVAGGGEPPSVNADVWKQFLNAQGPALQGLMGNYLEQSTQLFMEMQNQMQRQARTMFGSFPFPYGPAAAPSEPASSKPSNSKPSAGEKPRTDGEPE
ncbi:MAG: polyhydroxyalkanoate synthesis repressor PhaR [Betaproteobacteria bacterium]|nr:polyhydroxyalkanoate synthesis repressor PhaR [Betaproteobacteria bacterium]MDE2622311.1 polyhydroxyalkanoate synthesis repressor PhaR [Betaproteobacteria bacterium]